MPTPPSSLYVDGASQRPAVLLGRDDVEASLTSVLRDIETGRQPRHHGIVGARGMGKTTVLNTFRRVAQDKGHAVIMLRGGRADNESLLADLGHYTVELARKVRPLRRRGRAALKLSVSEMTATLNLGVVTAGIRTDPNRAVAATRSLSIATEQTLQLVAKELARVERGLLVLIDEAHAASSSDLRRITGLLETVAADSPNIALVMAGLPELQGATTESSFTFVERYAWHELEPLTRDETAQALRYPLEYQGRTLTDEGAAEAWRLSHGHPHVIQLVARHMEESSGSADVITDVHVAAAAARVRSEMLSVYRARWRKLNEKEKQLVREIAAGAQDTGRISVPFEYVAAAMGQSPRQIRDLAMGLDTVKVESRQGALRLDVPGIGEWVLREHPVLSNDRVVEQASPAEFSREIASGAPQAPDYQRLSLLIEQRAKRAELGLGVDPALEAEWSRALQEAGAGHHRSSRFTRVPNRTSTRVKSPSSTVELG